MVQIFPDGSSDGNGHVAYAESTDGVNWIKPVLNLKKFCGNTSNNLVSGLPAGTDNVSVIQDDDGLFKAAVMDCQGLKQEHISDEKLLAHWDSFTCCPTFAGIAQSSDGINWDYDRPAFPPIPEKLECCRLFKIKDKYILSGQQLKPWYQGPDYGRIVSFYVSNDLKTWEKQSAFYVNSDTQCHVGIAPLKLLGSGIVGLAGRFFNAPELPDQHFEIGLVYSTNGLDWQEVFPGQSFVRRNLPNYWDNGGILQGQGALDIDDETCFYYSGIDVGNTPLSKAKIGRCYFPSNHFGYLGLKVGWDIASDKQRCGELLTKLYTPDASKHHTLTLDVANLSSRQYILAELLDEGNNPIPGYSLADCDKLVSSGQAVKVSWREQSNIDFAYPFRIRLLLHGGRLRENSPQLYNIIINSSL